MDKDHGRPTSLAIIAETIYPNKIDKTKNATRINNCFKNVFTWKSFSTTFKTINAITATKIKIAKIIPKVAE